MKHTENQVRIWEEGILIPTYEVGEPDKNPMFLEKRVYQGSSGKVYPFPVIDKIYDEKKDKAYKAVWLENAYLKVMVLPELGGRIQRAYDKTNGYDFVYYNEVIKPALVGLTGPWISGGIEFNWPQHHRPTTFSPVEYMLCENTDGSVTLRINETDRMYGTKAMASITLYPGKAYIEIKGQLYNPTDLPQTFLWWANPAVAVNDQTQSIFPPDVHAVMDHGKRAVSRFPIATGEYYKQDYSRGVDISRYKNIPVPTSYMAYHSDFDFVGGYDEGVEAGILHIADHHVSPGKKQWTWGCGDFGRAWDRNLTDKNGPYIELMTGVFTDNQPDFTWLKPFEEKCFTQYFLPYKKVGGVKNASTEVVLNLTVNGEDTSGGEAHICVYTTSFYDRSAVVLTKGGDELYRKEGILSPNHILEDTIEIGEAKAHELTLSVYDKGGRLLLSYTPATRSIQPMPQPAKAPLSPEQLLTNEELYLTGLHLEQYRHATFLPDPYYLEGLKRDPGDSRINTAYGQLLLRRGLFKESEECFRKALSRLTWKNPNPYSGEAFYYLGLSLLYQNRDHEAYDAFYKATWSNEQQEMGFYYLAVLSMGKSRHEEALEQVERSLVKNSSNIRARGLKALILKALGRDTEKEAWLSENIKTDPFDYLSRFEKFGKGDAVTRGLIADNPHTLMDIASSYALYGLFHDALAVLDVCKAQNPLLAYHSAWYAHRAGDERLSQSWLARSSGFSSHYCFPNKLGDIEVLEYVMSVNPEDSKAPYYLGNLWYDRLQYARAKRLWERSARLYDSFPTVWRNLALLYYNKTREPEKARQALERAFDLDKTDARVFLELDQLYKKLGIPPEERIARFEANRDTFMKRDDLWVEYITLLNLLERYEEAHRLAMTHKFHPWEGGEGKITAQYTLSLMELARTALQEGEAPKAVHYLEKALVFPENLGEGKLEGANDNGVYYLLGCAKALLGDEKEAQENWEKASRGSQEPAGMMFYNDQPADLIFYQGLALGRLGREKEALSRFNRLLDYGEAHLFDKPTIDYFAVSLPDLQLFDEDLSMRNKAHCHYLIALGSFGLNRHERALDAIRETLSMDCAHIGAVQHKKVFSHHSTLVPN